MNIIYPSLALICITLALMHTFAAKRVGQMNYAELPLWYSMNGLGTCYVVTLMLLFWPTLVSGIIWSFVVLGWKIALAVIVASAIVAGVIEEKMPPMLTVLLTGLPSLLLAIIIWFVR
jgi:hypothetical protein